MKKNIFYIVLSFLLIFNFQNSLAQRIYPFQDETLEINSRIDDLISQLTLEEKASLMLHNNPSIDRLNIPEYNWWNESLHGVARAGKATVFPQSIGLAATFDNDLLYRIASAISDEARIKYNVAKAKGSTQQYTGLTFWSPNINIFRDPRWGRGQETYGEDPYLTSQLGVQFVKGMQGTNPKYLKTAACAKHFVAHSGPEKVRHEFNAIPNDIDFRETYLPAFKALVENGVETVMCAYNQLNGEPCCGNKDLLQNILRKELSFKGHIVSDCWALNDYITHQKIMSYKEEAAAKSIKAGVNLNCGTIYKSLPLAVKKELISEELIDSTLKPLLRTRFKLGLFDKIESSPYSYYGYEIVNSQKHKDLAYEAAVKSIVLLKNDKTLPLKLIDIHKINVTGPTAADNTVLMGNYNGFSGNFVTLLEGIINKVDAGTVVQYSKGAMLNTKDVYHGIYNAKYSDVTIASIGNSRMLEGEDGDAMLSTNGGDRLDIKLPENQIEFIRKLKAEAPDIKLIVVINGGSAIAIPEISKLADAILFVWYPGEQGGNAIADIIFGNENPSGKLPITFYSDLNELPSFDNYDMTNRTYRYYKGEALFPFGFGLSYSTFEYSDLKINKINSENIEIEFRVKKSSDIQGDEIVQLYVTEPSGRHKAPIKSLKAFKRVTLKAEELKTVRLKVKLDNLNQK